MPKGYGLSSRSKTMGSFVHPDDQPLVVQVSNAESTFVDVASRPEGQSMMSEGSLREGSMREGSMREESIPRSHAAAGTTDNRILAQQQTSANAEVGLSICLKDLLRHDAVNEKVAISEDGWINMEDALAYVNREGDSHTAADIRKVIGADTKGRYAMRFNPFASEDEHPDTALQIRANQGHTMEGVVPYLKRVDPEQVPTAVHGTYKDLWDSIYGGGLRKMRRKHIHMAREVAGQKSGMHTTCDLHVWVDIKRAVNEGKMEFFESENGVILTEGINGAITSSYFWKVKTADGQILFDRSGELNIGEQPYYRRLEAVTGPPKALLDTDFVQRSAVLRRASTENLGDSPTRTPGSSGARRRWGAETDWADLRQAVAQHAKRLANPEASASPRSGEAAILGSSKPEATCAAAPFVSDPSLEADVDGSAAVRDNRRSVGEADCEVDNALPGALGGIRDEATEADQRFLIAAFQGDYEAVKRAMKNSEGDAVTKDASEGRTKPSATFDADRPRSSVFGATMSRTDMTALMMAAGQDQVDVVRMLVKDAGADRAVQDEHGETALMKACRNGCVSTVRAPVSFGASHSPLPQLNARAALSARVQVRALLSFPAIKMADEASSLKREEQLEAHLALLNLCNDEDERAIHVAIKKLLALISASQTSQNAWGTSKRNSRFSLVVSASPERISAQKAVVKILVRKGAFEGLTDDKLVRCLLKDFDPNDFDLEHELVLMLARCFRHNSVRTLQLGLEVSRDFAELAESTHAMDGYTANEAARLAETAQMAVAALVKEHVLDEDQRVALFNLSQGQASSVLRLAAEVNCEHLLVDRLVLAQLSDDWYGELVRMCLERIDAEGYPIRSLGATTFCVGALGLAVAMHLLLLPLVALVPPVKGAVTALFEGCNPPQAAGDSSVTWSKSAVFYLFGLRFRPSSLVLFDVPLMKYIAAVLYSTGSVVFLTLLPPETTLLNLEAGEQLPPETTLMLAMSAAQVMAQLEQMHTGWKVWSWSPLNGVELVSWLLALAAVGEEVVLNKSVLADSFGAELDNSLFSFALLGLWGAVGQRVLQMFSWSRPLTQMLLRAVYDVLQWLAFLVVIEVAFTATVYKLFQRMPQHEYASHRELRDAASDTHHCDSFFEQMKSPGAIFVILTQTALGQYTLYDCMSVTTHSTASVALTMVFLLLVVILLINMLIALMNHSFEAVSSEAERKAHLMFTKMVLEWAAANKCIPPPLNLLQLPARLLAALLATGSRCLQDLRSSCGGHARLDDEAQLDDNAPSAGTMVNKNKKKMIQRKLGPQQNAYMGDPVSLAKEIETAIRHTRREHFFEGPATSARRLLEETAQKVAYLEANTARQIKRLAAKSEEPIEDAQNLSA